MDKLKGNLNLIIGLMTFLLIGFIVYNSFIKEEAMAGVEEISVGNMDVETRKIIEVLDEIDKIKIDAAFFNEKASKEGYSLVFNDLEDFSLPIPNKRPGKINPFIRGGAINYIDQKEDEVVAREEILENLNALNENGDGEIGNEEEAITL